MKHIDLTGQRFGSLTVIKRHDVKTKHNAKWICRCDCGRYVVVRSDNLKSGHTRHCSICGGNRGTASIFVDGVLTDGVV